MKGVAFEKERCTAGSFSDPVCRIQFATLVTDHRHVARWQIVFPDQRTCNRWDIPIWTPRRSTLVKCRTLLGDFHGTKNVQRPVLECPSPGEDCVYLFVGFAVLGLEIQTSLVSSQIPQCVDTVSWVGTFEVPSKYKCIQEARRSLPELVPQAPKKTASSEAITHQVAKVVYLARVS